MFHEKSNIYVPSKAYLSGMKEYVMGKEVALPLDVLFP